MGVKSELLARALEIKNETERGANTAVRVGSLLEDLISSLAIGVTLTLDLQGGLVEGGIEEVNVLYGKPVGDLPVPSKEENTFNGWFTEAVGGNEITESTLVDFMENITIYAQWTPN